MTEQEQEPGQKQRGFSRLSRRMFVLSAIGQAVLTLISRVLGLVREMLRAAFLGTGAGSDAFGVAVTLPNLFRRLLGEGQMTAAFLPTLVERIRSGDKKAVRQFYSDFLGVFSFILTVVVLLGYVFTPWVIDTWFSSGFAEGEAVHELTIRLTRVMFPYLGLVCTAAILQAALQANQLFWPSATTPILLNLCIIGCAYFMKDSFSDPSYAFAVGFVLGGFLQILFQVPFVLKMGLPLRPRMGWKNPHVRKVLRIFVPGVLAGGIYQIQVFVSQVYAAGLETGSVSSLQYSIRLQELVLGVFVVSITTVVLPTLSAQVADPETTDDELGKTLGFSGNVLALVTIPATIGLIFLGPPIIRLLFQYRQFDHHSADMVHQALFFHAMGLLPIAMSRNVMQVYYAKKDLKTPMFVAGLVLIVHITLCIILSEHMGHAGIALSGTIGATLTVGVLTALLHRKGLRVITVPFMSSLARCVLATAVLFGVIWFLADSLGLFRPLSASLLNADTLLSLDSATNLPWSDWFPVHAQETISRLQLGLRLAATVGAGALVYVTALVVSRHPEASQAFGAVSRKIRRR